MSQGFVKDYVQPVEAGGIIGVAYPWFTSTVPADHVHCNGQSLSATTYSELFDVLGYTYGGSGANFNVPDLRGEFLRGWDNGTGNDPDAASRTDRGDGTTGDNVGTKQDFEVEEHTHGAAYEVHGSVSGTPYYMATNKGGANSTDTIIHEYGGSETRPRNVAVMMIMRYKSTSITNSYPAGVTDVFINGTTQATTSGTTKLFSIPSGVKEFTLNFTQVSTDGSSPYRIRLGDADGLETTLYTASYGRIIGTTPATLASTGGFRINCTGASQIFSGQMRFSLLDEATNMWSCMGMFSRDDTAGLLMTSGTKALSGELTQVQFEAVSSNFDGGSVNIQYDNQELDLGSGVLSGSVVQTVYAQDGEMSSGTTTLPGDDSIPQITEGIEALSVSIIPKSATNLLRIDTTIYMGSTTASNTAMQAAIFQDSTADALAAGRAAKCDTTDDMSQVVITHWMTAGTVDLTTFSVRGGKGSSGTTYINGHAGTRSLGGVLNSHITVTEYAP